MAALCKKITLASKFAQTPSFSRGYVSPMANPIVLTASEFSALGAVDGTRSQPPMLPEIKQRLRDLYLVERREWPNGPLWRTTRGDRRVREGK